MTFGQYIKKKRFDLELTQAQLSKKIGVAQNYITYLENDERKPSSDIIKKLASALDLSFKKLYLMVNPDAEEAFPDSNEGAVLNPLLKSLKEDKVLRQKHCITDADINLLASIQARGEIRKVADYVYLLMTIRQVFQE